MTESTPEHNCIRAQGYYYDVLYGEQGPGAVPGAVLEHISECSHCRAAIARLKSVLSGSKESGAEGRGARGDIVSLLERHFGFIGEAVTCNTVRPFFASLARADLAIGIPTPITVHVDHCERCRKDVEAIRRLNMDRSQLEELSKVLAGERGGDEAVQGIDRCVMGILERPESGVSTVYRIDKSSESGDAAGKGWAWPGIFVEVGHGRAAGGGYQAESTRSTATKHSKWFLKAGAAAAAVVLAAVSVLFLARLGGKGPIGLEEIYQGVGAAANVHIATFVAGASAAAEERWISRTLKTYVVRNRDGMVLWDVGRKVIKPYGKSQVDRVSDRTFTSIGKEMAGALGLAPFSKLSDIPGDAEWEAVTSESLEMPAKDADVYELRWTETASNGSAVFRKWRVFIDGRTGLAVRSEFYSKSQSEGDYTLESVQAIRYLDARQMQSIVDEFGR